MNNKVCYIMSFYLGNRRRPCSNYKKDNLYLVKKQVEILSETKHNLNKIIFNFNVEPEHYPYISQLHALIPRSIQGADVDINIRKNEGISYGAWSDLFLKYKSEFDYYIFNEDDYFFVEHNWDTYLIDKYNSYEDCGYLCMLVREPLRWCWYRKNAGNSVGIASFEALIKIATMHGELPHPKSKKEYDNWEEGQHQFGFAFLEAGYNIYDVRDDYAVLGSWESPPNFKPYCDTWRHHNWNKNYLCVSSFAFDPNSTSHYICHNLEMLPDYQLTSYEEAMYCYNNSVDFWDLERNQDKKSNA